MKRLGSVALAALTAAALAIPASAAFTPKTFNAGKAASAPTIDGKMDDAYKSADEVKINVVTSGDGKTTGTARVLWDAKNMYVFFDVTDPVLTAKAPKLGCEIDSVEFMYDVSGTPGDITKINAGQFTAYYECEGVPKGQMGGYGKLNGELKASSKYVSTKTDKGYTLEMLVPFPASYTPADNAKIGAAFHINSDENGDGTTREGEIFANEGQTSAWSDTKVYDTLVLTDKVYTAPKPAAAKTADLGIISALASLVASGAVISLKKRK